MGEFDRVEHAQEERDKSNGVTESFDGCLNRDKLEMKCVNPHYSPVKILERKEARRILYEALSSLSETQRNRIYLYFWEQKSYSKIARLEGVDESAVRRSIARGLLQLRKSFIGTSISGNDFTEHSQTRYVKHIHPKKQTADRQNESDLLIHIYEGGSQDGE